MKVKTTGTVLSYNLTEQKMSSLEAVCRKLGIRIKSVPKDDFAKPIGALMGFTIETGEELDVCAKSVDFDDEMLVLYNITGTGLDKFLKAIKQAEATVVLKAILTADNQSWLPCKLCEELKKEHEQMSGMQ